MMFDGSVASYSSVIGLEGLRKVGKYSVDQNSNFMPSTCKSKYCCRVKLFVVGYFLDPPGLLG
jgi:hypothetical protein